MDTGVDPTLTFGTGRRRHVDLHQRRVEPGGTTYTATYNVADDDVDVADVTIDVTGAQDATGNAQEDYTPEAEFSIDTRTRPRPGRRSLSTTTQLVLPLLEFRNGYCC